MCGKFTAMASWRQVHAFSQPLIAEPSDNDQVVTYGVMRPVPVIILDRDTHKRMVVAMRWGYPHPRNARTPQYMHARGETIEATRTFAPSFHDGQRGIVLFNTFNEGEELETERGKKYTKQWTIDPRDGRARGFAFIWKRFDVPEVPLACVQVTVRANELIRRTIMANDPDPRMPAILEDEDWAKWLGEEPATVDELKAMLRTKEGVTWKMAPEKKEPKK